SQTKLLPISQNIVPREKRKMNRRAQKPLTLERSLGLRLGREDNLLFRKGYPLSPAPSLFPKNFAGFAVGFESGCAY
ncbi:MAG: hypothetical protein IJT87_03740, partial [Ruminiclostridium sp.]|nr:hypothetical protein [Ruminiclostridium sp.]